MWTVDKIKVASHRRGMPAPTVAQQKIDGWHLACFVQRDGSILWFGRKREEHLEMSKWVSHREWAAAVRAAKLPPYTCIFGEVYVPKGPASQVPTALRDIDSNLRWAAHAIPTWEGTDISIHEIKFVNGMLNGWGLETPETLAYDAKTDYSALSAEREWEGVVLKTSNTTGWSKVKVERTIDLVCTAISPGRPGKYFGMAGSIHGSAYIAGKLTEVACCSGMDDVQREEISHKDVGRVFEARYQLVAAGGRLRHPRFIRWRDDKPASECSWEEQVRR